MQHGADRSSRRTSQGGSLGDNWQPDDGLGTRSHAGVITFLGCGPVTRKASSLQGDALQLDVFQCLLLILKLHSAKKKNVSSTTQQADMAPGSLVTSEDTRGGGCSLNCTSTSLHRWKRLSSSPNDGPRPPTPLAPRTPARHCARAHFLPQQ